MNLFPCGLHLSLPALSTAPCPQGVPTAFSATPSGVPQMAFPDHSPQTQAQPPLGRPHLVDQPISGHDHQRVPASQVLRTHQLPGVVPPLCAEGAAINVGGWSRGSPGWGCSPRPLPGRNSPVSISVKETSAWASSGCTWLLKSCRALPLPPRGFNNTSTWQGLGSVFREPPAVNTNRNRH